MSQQESRKDEPLDHRLKVGLTATEAQALSELADAAGQTQAGYVRQLIRQALGSSTAQRTRYQRESRHRLAEVHELAVQIRKLGASLNLIAKQLDAHLLPEVHASIVSLHRGVEDAMRKAVTLFDALLAEVDPPVTTP